MFACFLTSTSAAAADFDGAKWTYERLFKESDVVLVVTLESSKEIDELIKVPDSTEEVQLLVSKLKCELVLKGDVKGKSVEFRHWRPKRGEILLGTPSPVCLSEENDFQHLQYMVFLRRTKGDQYEAVSGMIGAYYSVKEMHRPRIDDRYDRARGK